MVRVREAVVLIVMTSRSNNERDHIERLQIEQRIELGLHDEEVRHLSHISAVEVVVVLDLVVIAHGDLLKEPGELVLVDLGFNQVEVRQVVYHLVNHHGETVAATDQITELKDVELTRLDVLKCFFILIVHL